MPPDPFAELVAVLDAPMTIVTACDGTQRDGCLVGFHTQCSIAPRRWLVGLSKSNATYVLAQRARQLVVHVLHRDQHALAARFGGVTELHELDKLAGIAWQPGPDGAPVLAGCDWFAGPILERLDLGDHVGHLIAVETVVREYAGSAPAFGLQNARDIRAGNPP